MSKGLILSSLFFLFTIGCVGFPLNPISVSEIQTEKYFYRSREYQNSIMQLNDNFIKYKSRCNLPLGATPTIIEHDSDNTGFSIINMEPGNVLLYVRLIESDSKTTVKTWTQAPKVAEWFYYSLENITPCIESVWDKRISNKMK